MSDAVGSGFGKFVPGFEFLQNLAGQAAGGVAQGFGSGIPQMPNLGNWVAPTFNVEDLEKRIEELKAVHFWLDQNAKALGATIQALEVQKMTLATLKNMNFSLGDVANALKIKAVDAVSSFAGATPAAAPTPFAGLEIPARTYGTPAAPAAEPEEDEEAPEAAAAPKPRKATARQAAGPAPAPAGGVVDPMQWWGALSQQFQNIAATAMKDVARQTTLDTTRQVASGLTEQAVKTATGMAGKAAGSMARNMGTAVGLGKAAARAVSARTAPARRAAGSAGPQAVAKKAAAKKAAPKRVTAPAPRAANTQALSSGDWPLPTALFTGFQPAATSPAPQVAARKASAKKTAVKKAAPRRR